MPQRSKGPLARVTTELARRGVLQAGGSYLVASWLLLQVADVVFPALEIPDRVVTLMVIGLAVGFPVILVTSWMFDLRGFGLIRDKGLVEEGTNPPGLAPPAPARDHKSIAVLPFADLSPDQDQEYFAHGMAEELTHTLARIKGLRVAARTSTVHLSSQSVVLQEIGEQLGVGSVLEGSIRKSDKRLRITVRLVSVDTGFELYGDSFDREIEDVFSVQDELSRSVAESLKVQLLGQEAEPERTSATTNPAAYDLYLRGRYFWNMRYAVGLDTALEYFHQALELDPDYALPLAGIADTYSVMGLYGFGDGREAREKSRAAREEATRLGPDRPEVLFAEGLSQLVFEGDFWEAERAFSAAIARRPNFGDALAWLGLVRIAHGRFSSGEESLQAALEVEPHSNSVQGLVGYGYVWLRKYTAALEMSDRILKAHPESVLGLIVRTFALFGTGDLEAASRASSSAIAFSNRGDLPVSVGAWIASQRGDQKEAERLSRMLEEAAETRDVGAVHLAVARIARGDLESSISTLKQGVEEHAPGVSFVHWYTYWDGVRSRDSWKALMEDIGVVRTDPREPDDTSHAPAAHG